MIEVKVKKKRENLLERGEPKRLKGPKNQDRKRSSTGYLIHKEQIQQKGKEKGKSSTDGKRREVGKKKLVEWPTQAQKS